MQVRTLNECKNDEGPNTTTSEHIVAATVERDEDKGPSQAQGHHDISTQTRRTQRRNSAEVLDSPHQVRLLIFGRASTNRLAITKRRRN